MSPQECVNIVLSDESPDVKDRALHDYMAEWLRERPGVSQRVAAHGATQALLASVRAERRAELLRAFDVLSRHSNAQAQNLRATLQHLPIGTPVVAKNYGREEIVTFLGVRRTRFLASTDTGRRRSDCCDPALRPNRRRGSSNANRLWQWYGPP